jgi:hypothetical protein
MFSNLPERLWRSFTVRLSVWYTAIFTLSAVVLFGLLYVLLGAALERQDHEVIQTRLKACAAVYEEGGVVALQDFVQRTRDADQPRPFFVRIAVSLRHRIADERAAGLGAVRSRGAAPGR